MAGGEDNGWQQPAVLHWAEPIHQVADTIRGGIHVLLPSLGGQIASRRHLEHFCGALFLLLPTHTPHQALLVY